MAIGEDFDALERDMETVLRRTVAGQHNVFLERADSLAGDVAVQSGEMASMQNVMSLAEFNIIMREVMDALAFVFARGVDDNVRAGKGVRPWVDLQAAYISELLGKISKFNETTVRRLAQILIEAALQEEESPEDRKALFMTGAAAVFADIDSRIKLAANAGVVGAYNAGLMASAQTASTVEGYRFRKQWISRMDGRERHTHHMLHGSMVFLDEPFMSRGVPIRFPHDPLAPLDETINCRCFLTFY